MNSFKRVRAFQIELEFGSVGFWGEGKTGVPGEKPLGARERTNNKLNPHMASTPGVESGPHWWEARALTTVSLLLPKWPTCICSLNQCNFLIPVQGVFLFLGPAELLRSGFELLIQLTEPLVNLSWHHHRSLLPWQDPQSQAHIH